MAKIKESAAPAINEQTINEDLAMGLITENEAANVNEAPKTEDAPEVNKPLTRDELHQAFVTAKLKLREVEDANGFDANHPDVKKAELDQFNAKKALKDFDDAVAKEKLKADMEQKMVDARQTLKDVFGITDEQINSLLTPAADADDATKGLHAKAKENIKWSFNFVFGGPERNVKSTATSKDLTKPSQPATNGSNVNDVVKDLMDSGLTHNELLNLGHEEGRLRNVAYKIDYAKDKLTGKYSKRVR